MTEILSRLKNFYEPIGIDRAPVVMWEYKGDAAFSQVSYRVTVSGPCGTIYDSGSVRSKKQSCPCDGIKLSSHTKYKYSVEACDEAGQKASCRSSFVTGIIGEWDAGWISSGEGRAFRAVRDFRARGQVSEGYCSVTGLGQFVLCLNGKRVGDHVLDPGWTDYNKQVQYVTFDVSELLRDGENRFEAEVGCGWYIADQGGRHHYTAGFHGYRDFGRVLPFIFELTVRYEDGTEEKLLSDTDWSVSPAATTLSNIYGSEDYDARLEKTAAWSSAVTLSDEDAPGGVLTAMSHPPIKIARTYEAVSAVPKNGGVVYDFGQNMSGLFEIAVEGKAGQRVKLTPAEKLTADGDVLPSCNSYLIYTLGGSGVERWMPRFTYSAGRWVKVELFGEDDEVPRLLDIKAHFITSSAAQAGSFSCSDKRVEKIMNIIERAMDSNLGHVHTDCPTVERLGWLETSHLMAPSVMYYRDAETLWTKILRDARETQYEEGEEEADLTLPHFKYGAGMITSVAPRYARFVHAGDMGSFWDIVPWGSTVILGELQRRRFHGEGEFAADAYESAKRYLSYLERQYDDYEKIYGRGDGAHFLCHGLGDWGVLRVGTEARENVETAFFFHDLCVMAEEAKALGRNDDENRFRRIAERVREDYNSALLIKSEQTGDFFYRMYGDTEGRLVQTVQALPLYFGLVPEDRRESVTRSFLRSVSGRKIESGEIGLRYILGLIGQLGESDIVFDMMMQPEHPSYIRFIDKGETTLPEYWEDDARSHNHDMMGHIYEWIYAYAAGITSEDGFETVRVAPRPPQAITELCCSYHADTGMISERLTLDDALRMELVIPPNVTATVSLPPQYHNAAMDGAPTSGSEFRIAGGRHIITAKKI